MPKKKKECVRFKRTKIYCGGNQYEFSRICTENWVSNSPLKTRNSSTKFIIVTKNDRFVETVYLQTHTNAQ